MHEARADVRGQAHVAQRVLARGAGTSLAGQSCNVAVVVDFTNAQWTPRLVEAV